MNLDGRPGGEHAVVGHEAARAPRADARLRAGRAAARRADEPSRHRRDRLAGRFPAPLAGDAAVRDARPRVPAERWPRGFSRSIAAGCSTGRATTRRSWCARKRRSRPRKSRTRCSTRSWRKKRSGFARASRPAARATKAACGRSSNCGSSGASGATRSGTAKLDIQAGQRSGALVAKVEDISFAYGDRPIVRDFSTTIMRGDKIGVIGPNGAGKTTLLRLLLGQLAPQAGSVRLGTNLRSRLLRSAPRAARRRRDRAGQRRAAATRRSRSTAGRGTCSAICRISCSRPSGPARRCGSSPAASAIACCWRGCSPSRPMCSCSTNRRTISTPKRSSCWKSGSSSIDGTLLLVSHDRAFLNNVVTSTIVFEPGGVREYVGGYDDWLRQRSEEVAAATRRRASRSARNEIGRPRRGEPVPRRASPLVQGKARARIAAGEDCGARRRRSPGSTKKWPEPDFYQQPSQTIAQKSAALKDCDQQAGRGVCTVGRARATGE